MNPELEERPRGTKCLISRPGTPPGQEIWAAPSADHRQVVPWGFALALVSRQEGLREVGLGGKFASGAGTVFSPQTSGWILAGTRNILDLPAY